MNTTPRQWAKESAVAVLAILLLGLALTCGLTSSRWIHAPFPGFFIMANRVIASVSLPTWPIAQHQHLYQHAILAVNGHAVETSEELYTFVQNSSPGSPTSYTLKKDGLQSEQVLPIRIFTVQDYWLLFGSYLLSGFALAFTGLTVWWLKPTAPASFALLMVGLTGGIFAITGADLYGPHWFFRLHILGEAFFPASLVHLALVFPIDRTQRFRTLLVGFPYLISALLGVAYEVSLYTPDRYSRIHDLSTLYGAVGGFTLFSSVVWAYLTTHSHLVQQKIRIILIGFLSGFSLPALLMLSSAVTGGETSVNYAGFTTFLFPLSLGYAIVKHDLFEIDTMLRRSVYYFLLTVTLTVVYLVFLALLNWSLHSSELARSPLFPLLFTLTAVFLINPIKEHLQRGVDRVFFRLHYQPQKILDTASAVLAATLNLEEILSFIWHTVQETLGLEQGGVFLLTTDETAYAQFHPHLAGSPSLPVTHVFVRTLQQRGGKAFTLYDCLDPLLSIEAQAASRSALKHLFAQAVTPLLLKGKLIGFLAFGRKASGAFFSKDDMDFLSTLANQSALSIGNAFAYQKIHDFNVVLENKVEERTQALADTNIELQVSLEHLKHAYSTLQRSQENLMRAEKMADLGRLAAGIAHEMNTPLGASLTSLRLLKDLVAEYDSSIGDSSVNDRDHRAIAQEMDQLVDATQQWMEKAASHIRSLKLHTRNLQRSEECLFSVLQTIEDTRLLLAHQLRLSQCTLSVHCLTPEPMLYGDPSKLGQVLTNLITNAVDAYKAAGKDRGEILIIVSETANGVELRVNDQGCGIPPDQLPLIFDDLFSTKPLGEGTGLGLPISRDIMAKFFQGSVRVESFLGQGSSFILTFPHSEKPAADTASGELTPQHQPPEVAPTGSSARLHDSVVLL